MPAHTLLTLGNTAKLYCLERIDELVAVRGATTIVDLGCGDGRNFVELLRRHPQLRYVGVDPSADACSAARETLSGLGARIVNAPAYDVELEPADVVVSFSVLEHVYRRARYVKCIARHLKPGGLALVNYDAGHFVAGTPRERRRERLKGAMGHVLARFGNERYFQSLVREAEFRRLVDEAELQVVEARVFNTALKEVYSLLPDPARERFMRPWLALELEVNELGVSYTDAFAPVFRTRSFVLSRAARVE